MADHVETEFKLRAARPIEVAAMDAAIREAGFHCRAIDERHHVDVYLDDAHRSLWRSGIGLRVRDDRGHRTVTCKTRARRDGALFVRSEREAPWPGQGLPTVACDLPAELRDATESLTLDRPLAAILHLTVERESRLLQVDGRDVCTVVLDRVEASAGARTVAFAEIEIEIELVDELPLCERLAQTFLEHLPVRAAEDDKPSHAANLLGVAALAPPPTAPDPEAPTGATVIELVRHHLSAMSRAEIGVRTGGGADSPHEMRVALRRARGLVRAFRSLWPDDAATWLLDQLRATSRRLGELRDLDVLLADLPARCERLPAGLLGPAIETLLPRVRTRRDRVLAELRTWLGSPRRLADARALDERLGAIVTNELAAQPIAESLAPRLAQLVATTRKLATALPHDLPHDPTHRLRVAVKRLRYFVEDFAAFAAADHTRALRRLVELQGALGVVCDHERATHLLMDLIETAAADGGQAALAASLGGVATLHARDGRRARKRALRALARLDRRKVWRRLHPD